MLELTGHATELGKLFLSLLLALRDIFKEREALRKLNIHALPSLELYAKADELHRHSLYADDPYDAPQRSLRNLRRRSSAIQHFDLGISFVEKDCDVPLSQFQWPASPVLDAAFEKAGVIKVETKEGLRSYVPPTVLGTLASDIFGDGWWYMAVPALLFAVQNNLIYVAARNLSVPVFQITFQLKVGPLE